MATPLPRRDSPSVSVCKLDIWCAIVTSEYDTSSLCSPLFMPCLRVLATPAVVETQERSLTILAQQPLLHHPTTCKHLHELGTDARERRQGHGQWTPTVRPRTRLCTIVNSELSVYIYLHPLATLRQQEEEVESNPSRRGGLAFSPRHMSSSCSHGHYSPDCT
jgi:hypothetical protein